MKFLYIVKDLNTDIFIYCMSPYPVLQDFKDNFIKRINNYIGDIGNPTDIFIYGMLYDHRFSKISIDIKKINSYNVYKNIPKLTIASVLNKRNINNLLKHPTIHELIY